ncbi:M56 family metallopeptidase [Hufsiella ginkgonis]|uniref:M48 family metalloprotease n=1 Tax=Hufsiella ginkgonis TaxID=2695274 RepID=A0A7K1XUT8_9SPHI|nr:M56 family metallopeptidase [Hufsiella ginkgonis]MXV14771.1 M48 family metalloprotease [Hufsiella ginkgonis]
MSPEPVFIALSKTLFESCIQGLLVWLLIRLTILFSRNLTSHTRYRLLYSGLVLIFGSFVATLMWHINQVAVPVTGVELVYPVNPAAFPARIISHSYLDRGEYLVGTYARWIALFYLGGLMVNGVRLMIGYTQVRKMAGAAPLHQDLFWEKRLEQLAGRLGINRKVNLYFRELTEIPFTSGYLKPLIFFPIAAVNQLTTAQVEAILVHELAHIKRNDYLFNLLQQVMKSFLFYNPFAWLLNRDILREREYCCDDMVVLQSGNPAEYATALLHLEENRRSVPAFALASNGNHKYPLLNRIKRMIMKTPDPSPVQKISILLATVAICISIAWTIPETGMRKAIASIKNKTVPQKSASAFKTAAEKISAQHGSGKKTAVAGSDALFYATADTVIKSKSKVKVIIEDEKGNKREYNSVDEMPEDVREEFYAKTFGDKFKNLTDTAWSNKMQKWGLEMQQKFSSPEWKKQQDEIAKKFSAMGKDWEKQFNSEAWKKQQEEFTKMFSSPEWKKQQEDIVKLFTGPEWKKQQDAMIKLFSGPEWKKQQEEMTKYFNSPEIKKQMEEVQQHFNSPEWKHQVEELMKLSNGEHLIYVTDSLKKLTDEKKSLERQLEKNQQEIKKKENKNQEKNDDKNKKNDDRKNDNRASLKRAATPAVAFRSFTTAGEAAKAEAFREFSGFIGS